MKHQIGGLGCRMVTYLTYQCMWCVPKYLKNYRKKLGEQDVWLAPPIILYGGTCSPCSQCSGAYPLKPSFVCFCDIWSTCIFWVYFISCTKGFVSWVLAKILIGRASPKWPTVCRVGHINQSIRCRMLHLFVPADMSCPPEHFKCPGDRCISEYSLCDGFGDCPDNTDEHPQICRTNGQSPRAVIIITVSVCRHSHF